MRYAIIGAGAVGGYYGGRLAHSGSDVHFLLRSDYEAVKRDGLRVKSCDGDFSVSVNAYRDSADLPAPDLAIVALKAVDTPLLAEILPSFLGEHSFVATLQNGLGNEEAIASIVGPDRVIAGSAFICCEREAPGVIGHYSVGALGFAPFGDRGAASPIIARIAEDFSKAGVRVRIEDSAAKLKWGKLVWNIPFSGLAVYYKGATTDIVLGDPAKREFAERLMREVIVAARADGAAIEDEEVEKNFRATEKMGAYRPSMLVDFQKGRPMEIEAIIGEPLRRGRKAGLTLPALEELYRGVKAAS